ncbi:MAG: hypothetical protein RMK57_15375 [Bryobacterales bacterium]|nr:hypothetical protein [Bryobacteraceae bacterium]MDW8355902.1 hypothetical protein [Bryobacterales bacterium]
MPVEPVACTLSVVVAMVSDTTDASYDCSHLVRCLEGLHSQKGPPPMEIIVPHHAHIPAIADLKRRYPAVRFLPVDDLPRYRGLGRRHQHHNELRARGLAAARGEIVCLIEDHARPREDWCAAIVRAHQKDVAGVGGAIENGLSTTLSWAVYFSDFAAYQNPVPDGETGMISDANSSYKRAALEETREVWREAFNQVAVNQALLARGRKLAISSEIVVYQQRVRLGLWSALLERFIWGRHFGASRTQWVPASRRIVYFLLSPLLPAVLMARMARTTWARRRNRGAFLRALPLTLLLTCAWSLGEAAGYLTGVSAKPDSSIGPASPGS